MLCKTKSGNGQIKNMIIHTHTHINLKGNYDLATLRANRISGVCLISGVILAISRESSAGST